MLNKRICSSLALLLLLMVGFSACMTKKKLTELKINHQIFRTGMDSINGSIDWQERKIIKGDRLSITIKTETLNQVQLEWFDNGKETVYVVSDEGWINLPIIGKIFLIGMGRKEAMSVIKERLSKIIKDPFVQIKPLEITVKVIGVVERPSNIVLSENDATLINVLVQAGGLNNLSRKDSITVIRTFDDKRELYSVDIRDGKKFFNSPAFRLMQNDVVVVNPNDYYFKQIKNQETSINIARLTPVSIIAGLITILVPIIITITR